MSGHRVQLPHPYGELVWQLNGARVDENSPVLARLTDLSAELKSIKLYQPERDGGKPIRAWLKQARIPWWLREELPIIRSGSWLWLPGVGWLNEVSGEQPPLIISMQQGDED